MRSSSARCGRRQMSLILLLALVVCLALGPLGTANSWAFTDVPGDFWAWAWINWLADLDLVKGYSDGGYKPDDPVTRAQMAVYIGRAVQYSHRLHGLAWVTPTGSAEVEVTAVADLNAIRDPGLADPTAAGYRLDSSSDGVNFSPATDALYLGLDLGLVSWAVSGLTEDTYLRPMAIISTDPKLEVPLSGVLMARPGDTPANITVTSPPVMGAPRLPTITWNPVPGAVTYLVIVSPSSPPDADPVYAVALEGWRTSVLFGYRAGPGIIAGFPKAEALSASTHYDLAIMAVDATGWAIAFAQPTFTTGP